MQKGNRKTKLFSLILAIVMVVSSITVWDGRNDAKAADSYTELTFSDFGFEDGNYASGNMKRNNTLRSLDGVAITGDVKFTSSGEHTGLQLEAGDSGWTTFQVYRVNDLLVVYHWGATSSDTLYYGSGDFGGVDLSMSTVRMRLCFDKESDSGILATVTMTIGDVSITKEMHMEGVSDMVATDNGYRIGPAESTPSIYFQSVTAEEEPDEPSEPSDDENQVYTFSDFGIEEGNYAGTYAHGVLPEGVTSWDGVSLVGEIIIPVNDSNPYIGIAGTEEIASGIKLFGANGNQLWFWNDLTGKNHLGVTEGQIDDNGNALGTVHGEKLKIQCDFKLVDGGVQMQFTVNDAWTYNWTFSETAEALGNRLIISGNITVYDVKDEEEPEEPGETEYTELTFSDFGWDDGTYSSPIWKENKTIITLDTVAITGDVKFATNGPHTGFRIDPMKDDWANFQVYRVDNLLVVTHHTGGAGSDTLYFSTEDLHVTDLSTTTVRMRLCFDKESASSLRVTVTMSVDDTALTRTGVIYDVADLVASSSGYRIGAAGSTVAPGITIASVGDETDEPDEPIIPDEPDEPIIPDEPEEVEYTELTFKDLGIKDANYAGSYATGTLPENIASFDEVAITGVVTIPKDNDSPYIGFAGTDSIVSGVKLFGAYGNSLWMWNDLTGKNHLGINEGDADENGNILGAVQGVPLKIWVGFDFVDNDVHMKLVLGEAWTHSWIIADSADAFGRNVTVSGDITIGEPKVYEYTEVSFKDFGIVGRQLTGETVLSTKTPAKNMNLLKFVGYVTFPDMRDNGHISIGGKDGNNGIAVFWQSDNIWFWDETGANQGCIEAFKPEDLGLESFTGREMKVAISFAYDESDVLITMSLDNQVEKTKFLTGYKKWLGTEVKCVAGNGKALTYRSSLTETIKKPIVNQTPLKKLSKYETVTFIEMGLDDETVKGFGREDKGKIDTLDGKAFQGFVTFPADGQGIIRIGGTAENKWYGIHIEASSGGLRLFEAANGRQQWNIASDVIGKDITDKKIKLTLTFTKLDDNNVYVGVYVDDKFCGEKLFENLEQPFGSGLLVYSETAGIKIASVETAWQRFLKSMVNLAYFGFTDNWKQELADICR